jgi:solute carrier organic anion transporter family, member 4A
MFFTFVATMPALSATLRCVDEQQKSFGLGIQWIVVRMFGTIPAPILFGRLIDESCILWTEESCGSYSGSCLLYDNKTMAKYMLFLAFIGKFCSVLFFSLAWYTYIPPKVSDVKSSQSKYVKKEKEKY